jgi:hypothetical protein
VTAFAPAHTPDTNVGSSFSPSNAITAGHGYSILLITFGASITSITASNGDTLTKARDQVNLSNDVTGAIFNCLSSAGGTPTFTITSGGTTGYIYVEWNQAIASVRNVNSQALNSNSPSSGTAAAQAGDVAVGLLGSSGDTYTNYPTTGWTDLGSSIPSIQNGEYLPVVSSSSPAATATISSVENWVGLIAVLAPAGGGTNYTQTVTDDAGSTDNRVQAAGYARAETDDTGLTDQDSAQSVSYTETVTDQTGSTDVVGQAAASVRSTVDSAGTTDTLARALAAAQTVTDPAGTTDTISQASSSGNTQTVTDTAGTTDTVGQSVAYVRTVTDDAGSVDAFVQPSTIAIPVTVAGSDRPLTTVTATDRPRSDPIRHRPDRHAVGARPGGRVGH